MSFPLGAGMALALIVLILLAGCLSQSQPLQGAQPGDGQDAALGSRQGNPPGAQQENPPASQQGTAAAPRAQAISRLGSIPDDAVKMAPETDAHPPKSETGEYGQPIPLDSPISTAGAEDSPFITPGGGELYFFFTPDVRVPAEKQLFDNVTGIWVSKKQPDGKWGEPAKVRLQDEGRLSLDGCEFVQGDRMWFCSAREGYVGLHWFTADFAGGKWRNYQNADFEPSYQVGELHMSRNGSELYFHSGRSNGLGGLDIWMSKKENGKWGEPQNVEAVNTERDEGWPFLSQDGNELWFSHDYGVWRSRKENGSWQQPVLMFSSLAGEPSLDSEGNVYFVHHYFEGDRMIEADIYIAEKK